MDPIFIRKNMVLVSILLFLAIFIPVQYYKPGFLYNSDGSIRNFGIGYRNKTILPVWLFAIVLGILVYVLIMYYLSHPTLF